MNGLVNLNKPSGISSAAAVARVKRILGEKTVGHMGTLDPMAEGVLAIGVGKAARLFDYFCGKDKTYVAKFTFGAETDTLDALGTVTATTADIPSIDAVSNAMQSLVGMIEQIPPAYSAKHIDGKRAYALARGGAAVEPKPVEVEIYGAELVCQPRMDEAVFKIDCSSGTYIRSICRDVGRMCGSLATLTFLRRTRSGAFRIEDSVTLENLEADGGAVIPAERVIDLPRYDVPPELESDLENGRRVPFDMDGRYKVYCLDRFYGIGAAVNGALKIVTYLADDGEKR